MDKIRIGLRSQAQLEVGKEQTAREAGSGGLEVLATPEMAKLVEKVCFGLLEPLMEKGKTSVGSKIKLEHLAPTPVGEKVNIEAEVVDVQGNRVSFEGRLWDGRGEVGKTEHERVVVDRRRFMEKLEER